MKNKCPKCHIGDMKYGQGIHMDHSLAPTGECSRGVPALTQVMKCTECGYSYLKRNRTILSLNRTLK